MDIVLALAMFAILVSVGAAIFVVRQGPPKEGDALPGNRDETNLGGS